MKDRVAAVARLATRIALVAILAYPLTAATAQAPDHRYADYLVDQPSDGQCFDQSSPHEGGWTCWMPAPDGP